MFSLAGQKMPPSRGAYDICVEENIVCTTGGIIFSLFCHARCLWNSSSVSRTSATTRSAEIAINTKCLLLSLDA